MKNTYNIIKENYDTDTYAKIGTLITNKAKAIAFAKKQAKNNPDFVYSVNNEVTGELIWLS